MLEIKNLHANINGKEILKGINLSVKAGEVHAIMGPNGSGKSTLSSVLVGNPAFEVTEGEVIFNGKNLLDLEPEDRSREGIFLSFQYPVEIPGVSMVNFMRAALNEHRKYKGLESVSATDFLKLMREKRAIVELDNKLASRSVNEGGYRDHALPTSAGLYQARRGPCPLQRTYCQNRRSRTGSRTRRKRLRLDQERDGRRIRIIRHRLHAKSV